MPEDKNAWSAPNSDKVCYMCGRRYSQWPGPGCGLEELHDPYRASRPSELQRVMVIPSKPQPASTTNPSEGISHSKRREPPAKAQPSKSVISPEEPPTKYCTNCGTRVHVDDRFCEHCGYSLRGAGPQTEKPVAYPVQNLKQSETLSTSSKETNWFPSGQSNEEPTRDITEVTRSSDTQGAAMLQQQPREDLNRLISRPSVKAAEIEEPALTRPIWAFNFSMTGGIFTIAGGAVESLAVGWWFLAVGLVCGTVILLGARLQYSGIPSSVRKGSWLVLVFSVVALILMELVGMLVGLPLCLIGAWKGLKWKQL
jgi:hypothetical protein